MAGPIQVPAEGYGLTSADQIVDPDFAIDEVTGVDQAQINAHLKEQLDNIDTSLSGHLVFMGTIDGNADDSGSYFPGTDFMYAGGGLNKGSLSKGMVFYSSFSGNLPVPNTPTLTEGALVIIATDITDGDNEESDFLVLCHSEAEALTTDEIDSILESE